MPRSFRPHPKPEPFWRDLLARWKASGQPVVAFCTRHGVRPASFYAWRRKLAAAPSDTNSSPTPAPKFAAVHVVPEATVEVLLPGGLVARVPTGVDPTAVARLVAALGRQPC